MRHPFRTSTALASGALLVAVLAACSSGGGDDVGEVPVVPTGAPSTSGTAGQSASPAPRSTREPALAVEVVTGGLEHGWDIGFLPDGKVLVTERPARITLV
ncbi:MAG TPA: hypothetical protein VF140_03305, partial [Phycicoccus sp.]